MLLGSLSLSLAERPLPNSHNDIKKVLLMCLIFACSSCETICEYPIPIPSPDLALLLFFFMVFMVYLWISAFAASLEGFWESKRVFFF